MASSRAAIAARAFEKTLEELHLPADAPDLRDPAELGRRAALLATAEAIWEDQIGPLFDAAQAKLILRIGNRQGLSYLARRGRLLELAASGRRKMYPAFQFDKTGRPYPDIPQVLRIFRGVVQTPYTIASWFVTPQDLLAGERPAAWIKARREPAPLL